MGNWSYLSRDKLKTDLGLTDTADDDALRNALEEATEQIDDYLYRTFRVRTATRYYTAKNGRALDVDDLLSITTLKVLTDNSAGTRTYGDTLAAVDYDLYPANAAADREPYTQIRTNPEGAYTFPTSALGVQVIGTHGYFSDLETVASLANEAMDTSETGFNVDAGTDFDVLDTLLVDSEQMYVTAITSNTLTVVRGVNGTTAAAHSDDAVIQRYRYPQAIIAACRMQAARLFMANKAPGQNLQGIEGGGGALRTDLGWDVRNRIDRYRHVLALISV